MASVEKVVEQSLLYDFYGELLTEHQQKIYEAALFEDYSLSEIAEEAGISRQGVHDLLRRCDKQLRTYEAKLHLVERFTGVRFRVERIRRLVEELQGTQTDAFRENDSEKLHEIGDLAAELMEEL